ncbi:MAG: GNAT family N-acetyltransferase [Dehalococcoidia bacterium]|nr:GNAT family N-acetyltransferase [Dehalococcoidia bacterium]
MSGTLTLPRAARLNDGTEVRLRLLRRSDRAALLAFTTSLPEHDLLFLRIDISDPDVIDVWLDNIDLGGIVTIVAERDGRVLGYGSLHMANAQWSRHVGELRVLIGEELRGKGLGRALTEAIFAQALEHGIEKMVAQMTVDQKGAIATFEELGFHPEALLRDHVRDRAGEKHDLLVYAHEVAAFQSQLDAYGVTEAASG